MRSRSLVGRVRRAVLVVGLTLAAMPAADAAAVPVGQTGGAGGGATCPIGDVVRTDLSYVVPEGGGRITSFSFESSAANAGYQLDFMVLRPTGSGTYTVVGKTGAVALQGTGLETFAADIAVQGGELIGFWQAPGFLAGCAYFGGSETFATSLSSGNPAIGDAVAFTGPITLVNLNLAAELVTGPTSRADCKKGGWRAFGSFRNQGECVTLFDEGDD